MADERKRVPVVEATRPGWCGLCEEPIDEGQRIALVDDEWVHVDCAIDEGIEL